MNKKTGWYYESAKKRYVYFDAEGEMTAWCDESYWNNFSAMYRLKHGNIPILEED